MPEQTIVFPVNYKAAFLRWVAPAVGIAGLVGARKIDGLRDPATFTRTLYWLAACAAIALVVPGLRLLLIRHRRVEIGPDWIHGPTEELFQSLTINSGDIEEVEYSEEEERIQIRSRRYCSIVLFLKDYSRDHRENLLERVRSLQPATDA